MKLAFVSVFLILSFGLFLTPLPSGAVGGIVPCDGIHCQTCDLVQLGQNLITWFIKTMAAVIALVFAWGGMKMVMSGGNTEGVSEAKGMMTNAVIGFIILLASWLIVDTILKAVTDEGTLGPWNEITCVAQPEYSWNPVVNGSRGVSNSSPNGKLLPEVAALVGTQREKLCQVAAAYDIESECASLQAIMTQESGGDPNAKSNAGAYGLMQVTPGAARSLDPSLEGLSDSQVIQKLLNPDYNMKIGVAYYKKAVDIYGKSNYEQIYASYNGGFGATGQSRDCPGMQKWECEWDNKDHTIRNTGYEETRDYVKKVENYRKQYGG
jgi:hypothetical protein